MYSDAKMGHSGADCCIRGRMYSEDSSHGKEYLSSNRFIPTCGAFLDLSTTIESTTTSLNAVDRDAQSMAATVP